ncbi:MAG TPA: hypothetical protein VGP27_12380 [Mycobacterium sp.]|jgi:hypothetical protein|nr:hypothetical protein [Mycobacterium sp.]
MVGTYDTGEPVANLGREPEHDVPGPVVDGGGGDLAVGVSFEDGHAFDLGASR